MSTEGEDKLERVVAIRGAHPGVSTKVIFVGTAISGTHIVVVFLALSLSWFKLELVIQMSKCKMISKCVCKEHLQLALPQFARSSELNVCGKY